METMSPPPAHIPLAPEAWYWATWRNLPPLPRPAVRPYDRTACMAMILRMLPKETYRPSWYETTHNTYLASDRKLHLAPEEACLWLELRRVFETQTLYDRDALISTMAGYQPDIAQMLGWCQENIAHVWLTPLMSLATPTQLVDLVIADERRTGAQRSSYAKSFMAAFRSLVLPYLGAEEREQMRSRLRDGIDMARWPTLISERHDRAGTSFYLAAALGMQDVIAQILAAVDAAREESQSYRFRDLDIDEIIYGIDSADAMQTQIQRYKEKGIISSPHMRPWVAHTELAAIHMLIDSIVPTELAILPTPDLAPTMLAAIHEEEKKYHYTKKHLADVRRWFYDYREVAVAGLRAIPSDSPLWPLAMRTLHQAALGNLPVPDGVLLAEADTPAWLREAAQAVAQYPERHAAWIDATLLPPIAHQGRLLTHDQLDAILHALRASADAPRDPLLALVRDWLAPDQRERLVEYLYGYWQTQPLWNKPPSSKKAWKKEAWAVTSLGLLGERGAVENLAGFIETARREGRGEDARRALAALGVSDSDAVVEVLLRYRQATSMRSIHAQVEELLAQIASRRGCTVEDLKRRHHISSYGLDGSMWFGVNAATYWPILDGMSIPALRDAAGTIYASYPKPATKPIAADFAREQRRWHRYYHHLLAQIPLHMAWFEQAMINQQRWAVPDLRESILDHPLLGQIARRLLWAAHTADGARQIVYFTEDGSAINEYYQAVELAAYDDCTIAHLALIAPEQRRRWMELLEDFASLEPFPQISRPIYTCEQIEHTPNAFIGVVGQILPERRLNKTLLQHKWNSGHEAKEHTMRYFSGADTTAVLAHQPATVASRQPSRALGQLWFVAGKHFSHHHIADVPRIPIEQVNPIVLSEAVRDVMQVLHG